MTGTGGIFRRWATRGKPADGARSTRGERLLHAFWASLVALAMAAAMFLEPIDWMIWNVQSRVTDLPPSGEIVYVQADSTLADPEAPARRAELADTLDRLRAQGAVVILPEYRIKSRDRSTVLEAMEDGFALMDQISQSADCLGVDLARVCVGGGSAGGHLAAWIATGAHPNGPQTPQALKPAALLLLNPAVNFPIDQAASKGYSQQQKFSTRGLAKLSALDPMPHIEPGHPDTLILHGDHDQLVPVDKVKGYAAALQNQNVTVTLKIYPGRAHAFFNQTVSSDDFESSCATLIDFLAERSLLDSAAVIRPSETF